LVVTHLYVLRKKWLYPILLYLKGSTRNFTQFKKDLRISTKVLAHNLKVLQQLGLIRRQLMEDRTTNYDLTEKGKQIVDLLSQIEKVLKQ